MQFNSTKTITALSQLDGRVYVFLPTNKLAEKFMNHIEAEGFTFIDGVKPTARHTSNIMALNPDHTINYVTSIGHIAYGSGVETIGNKPLIRINYAEWCGVAKNGLQNNCS